MLDLVTVHQPQINIFLWICFWKSNNWWNVIEKRLPCWKSTSDNFHDFLDYRVLYFRLLLARSGVWCFFGKYHELCYSSVCAINVGPSWFAK